MSKYSDDFLEQLVEDGVTVLTLLRMYAGSSIEVAEATRVPASSMRPDRSRLVYTRHGIYVNSFEWR